MRVIILLLAAVLSVQCSIVKRDAQNDAENLATDIESEVTGFIDSIWGGQCVEDKNCMAVISYCKRESSIQVIGECQLNWWIFVVAAVLILLLAASCCACICLPCCCLYACCSSILDCLCCCCRTKGYSPAGRG